MFIVSNLVIYMLAVRQGRRNERERCESLCHQAIAGKGGRMSGSVRWVWNAISEGRTQLVPADEYFFDGEE